MVNHKKLSDAALIVSAVSLIFSMVVLAITMT